MTRTILKSIFIFTPILLTACSTLQYGKQQSLTVYTKPQDTHCTLKNDLGSTSISGTPAVAYVYPSKNPLVIECSKFGYRTMTYKIPSKPNDFSKGAVVGSYFIVSQRFAETSAYQYPKEINLTLPVAK